MNFIYIKYKNNIAPPIFPENNRSSQTKTIKISTDDAVNLKCNALSSPIEKVPVVTRWMKNGILIRSFQRIQLLFTLFWIYTLHSKLDFKTQSYKYVIDALLLDLIVSLKNEYIIRIVGITITRVPDWQSECLIKRPNCHICRLMWITTSILIQLIKRPFFIIYLLFSWFFWEIWSFILTELNCFSLTIINRIIDLLSLNDKLKKKMKVVVVF